MSQLLYTEFLMFWMLHQMNPEVEVFKRQGYLMKMNPNVFRRTKRSEWLQTDIVTTNERKFNCLWKLKLILEPASHQWSVKHEYLVSTKWKLTTAMLVVTAHSSCSSWTCLHLHCIPFYTCQISAFFSSANTHRSSEAALTNKALSVGQKMKCT